MTNVRWDVGSEISVPTSIAATRVVDATPVASTPLDLRTLPVGSRIVVLLQAFETNAANTGGTWTVTESDASGGSYTAATLGTALVATPASAGNDVQKTAVKPNPTKPFVKITYTGADANAEVDITAQILALPR